MSSIKQRLMVELEKRIAKNKAYKEKAKDDSVDSAVFEFFRQSDEAKKICNGETYEGSLLAGALDVLAKKLRQKDNNVSVNIEWSENSSLTSSQIRGVSIRWSPFYANANSLDAYLYIDISEMMLR